METDGAEAELSTRDTAKSHTKTLGGNMADEMLNKTKPYDKSSGLQGIGDTVDLMDSYDMNKLNDSIGPHQSGKSVVKSHSKNS